MALRFSQRLAVLLALALPVIETTRRWTELRTGAVFWPAYLDDILIAGFLLCSAWAVARHASTGRAWLTSAWGFTCGIAYSSLAIQLANMAQPDPSGLPSSLVLAFRGFGLAVALGGLGLGLAGQRHE